MYRLCKPAGAVLASVAFVALAAPTLRAQDGSATTSSPQSAPGEASVVAPATPPSDPDPDLAVASVPQRDGRSLHIEGDATALRIDVHQTSVADVLAALETFNIRYYSSTGLNEQLDGAYSGSLGHVLARLLDGYNYATKQDGSGVVVVIFGRRGEQTLTAPVITPARRRTSE